MGILTQIVEFDVEVGCSIEEAAEAAIEICRRNYSKAKFSINGATVIVSSTHTVDMAVRQFWSEQSKRSFAQDGERQQRFMRYFKEALAALDSIPDENVSLRNDMRSLIDSM